MAVKRKQRAMREQNKAIEAVIRSREYREALGLPSEVSEEYRLLAQGEYNINYLFTHPMTGRKLILRVNAGSQMHLDRQIEYEAHALRLLRDTGRTPEVLYTDGSKKYADKGILVMEYLPGSYPHYDDRDEMDAVMKCMADIHSLRIPESEVIWGEPDAVPRDTAKLIAPADSAAAILDECEAMVTTYMDSPLGTDEIMLGLVEPERMVAVNSLLDDPTTSSMVQLGKKVAKKVDYPTAEEIFSLQPDLVIIPDWGDLARVNVLRDLGIPVVVCKGPRNLADIKETITLLAQVTGEPERGEKLLQNMDSKITFHLYL